MPKLPEQRPTSLVHGIIAMAHSMGLSVVSEGIETWSDVETLRDLGCTTGQGFLFGRALDLPVAQELVTGDSLLEPYERRTTADPSPVTA